MRHTLNWVVSGAVAVLGTAPAFGQAFTMGPFNHPTGGFSGVRTQSHMNLLQSGESAPPLDIYTPDIFTVGPLSMPDSYTFTDGSWGNTLVTCRAAFATTSTVTSISGGTDHEVSCEMLTSDFIVAASDGFQYFNFTVPVAGSFNMTWTTARTGSTPEQAATAWWLTPVDASGGLSGPPLASVPGGDSGTVTGTIPAGVYRLDVFSGLHHFGGWGPYTASSTADMDFTFTVTVPGPGTVASLACLLVGVGRRRR